MPAIVKALKLFLSVAGIVPFGAILKAVKSVGKKPAAARGLKLLSKLTAKEVKDLVAEVQALAKQVKDSAADGKTSPDEALALAESALQLAQHVAAAVE